MEVQVTVGRQTRRSPIGELSEATGVPVRTIRFYCDTGLLAFERTGGGHRTFDAAVAVDRLLLIRRLRALGLGLAAITEVLGGERSIGEVVDAERAALDIEVEALAWRRAALLAVRDSDPDDRAARLELLAGVADRTVAQDTLVMFWHGALSALPPDLLDAFVTMNVPMLPGEPSPGQLVGFAELVAAVTDPAVRLLLKQQLWRRDPFRVRDRRGLLVGVAEACLEVGSRLAEGVPPRPGAELDRFVDAHARARGERDTPELRRQLHIGGSGARVDRYWSVTGELLGDPITSATALSWLDEALALSLPGAVDRIVPA
ncbi:MerR family transcriptional regulator [Nocardia sp. NPDC005978]|uniref:MerR family transcriptional regulator n=1 Tax=Nocardia sp. NPDC005978 TaxID=3156725 RepID=UPI0033B21155